MNTISRFLLAVCLTGLATSWAVAQQPAPVAELPQVQPPASGPPGFPGQMGMGHPGFGGEWMSPDDPRAPVAQRLGELSQSLANAAEGETETIVAEIETALGEYFDLDMEHRRAELQRLEERADETEALNARRLESRTELIDLQFEAYVQEADGLELQLPAAGAGFPSVAPYAQWPGMRGEMVRGGLGGVVHEIVLEPGPGGRSGVIVVAHDEELQAAMQRIHEARQSLSAAADDDARAAASDELKAALSDYFDRDMEHRATELESIRAGLTALETRIGERAENRDDIIAIQLKMRINQAEGLGFFGGGTYSAPLPFPPTAPPAVPR
jgi:hypothetical protein